MYWNMHGYKYIHLYAITMNKKDVMNLKKAGKIYGRVWRKEGKGRNVITL